MTTDEILTVAMETRIAWAAGLFEGEGCIRLSGRHVQITLGMTDADMVERFGRVVGCGTRGTYKRGELKRMHVWRISAAPDVIRTLTAFLPWLGQRRHARALQCLAMAQTMQLPPGLRSHCPAGHPYSGANLYQTTQGGGQKRRACRECRRLYQQRKAEQRREQMRAWRGANRDRIRLRAQEWRRRQSPEWKAASIARLRETRKAS